MQSCRSQVLTTRAPAAQVATIVPGRWASCTAVRAASCAPRLAGWQPAAQRRLVCTLAKGGVLDAPVKETSTENTTEKSKEFKEKKPPVYKVLLHNDAVNRREYVVKVLLKVVKIMTVDDAVRTMTEAHETGVGMVIVCPQEDAESYCESLRLNGLTSTIEPGHN